MRRHIWVPDLPKKVYGVTIRQEDEETVLVNPSLYEDKEVEVEKKDDKDYLDHLKAERNAK